MDTGRIKMENYQGILYCDAYMNDEFTLHDLEAIRSEIRKHYSSRADVILKKTGTYSVAADAQLTALKGINEFRNFVYVVDSDIKFQSAEFAVHSYMKGYNTGIASSKEQAFAMLSEQDK